jgi:hypothetical protein
MPTKYLLPHLPGITFAIPHKLNHELSDHSHYGIVAFDQLQIGQQVVERRRHDGNLLGLERATFLLFFLNKLEKGLRWHDLSRTRWVSGASESAAENTLPAWNSTVRYRTKSGYRDTLSAAERMR